MLQRCLHITAGYIPHVLYDTKKKKVQRTAFESKGGEL